ncbi:hypothetical protein U1Q18_026258 [Sarracenia purpurea var. burkii]
MASSFTDSFDQLSNDSQPPASTRPFDDDDDDYVSYDPRLSSERFDLFSNLPDSEEVKAAVDDSPISISQPISDTPSPPPVYVSGGGFSPDPEEFSSFSPEANGKAFDGGYVAADGPILSSPGEMEPEEGFILREWRRHNAIRLEEKEMREKELLTQIIAEAEEFKLDFYSRRKVNCETNKATNREKEKLFLASQEKFHSETDKNFWKAITELIPNEVAAIEKKRVKKEQEKPSIVVVQGPKPGKPTDRSRMRQILLKLKHDTPPHLKPSLPPALAPTKDAKTGGAASHPSAAPQSTPVATAVEAIAVA